MESGEVLGKAALDVMTKKYVRLRETVGMD